jgi:hypothetical protein
LNAVSLASDPELANSTRPMGTGAQRISSAASSVTGPGTLPENEW